MSEEIDNPPMNVMLSTFLKKYHPTKGVYVIGMACYFTSRCKISIDMPGWVLS